MAVHGLPFPRRGRNVRRPGQTGRPVICKLSFPPWKALIGLWDAAPADLPELSGNVPSLQIIRERHARRTLPCRALYTKHAWEIRICLGGFS
ncbi:hypothetical protein CGRA01v4_11982 [Colletotrichum graminicola]|nr:hypothetical protein CGRA01v4_11982 [Colletotrichum graminicola]